MKFRTDELDCTDSIRCMSQRSVASFACTKNLGITFGSNVVHFLVWKLSQNPNLSSLHWWNRREITFFGHPGLWLQGYLPFDIFPQIFLKLKYTFLEQKISGNSNFSLHDWCNHKKITFFGPSRAWASRDPFYPHSFTRQPYITSLYMVELKMRACCSVNPSLVALLSLSPEVSSIVRLTR